MTKDIKARVQGQDPNIVPRDINKFIEKEGVSSVYEALAIIIKRTKFVTYDLKEELKSKLEDFTLTHESIEEIIENREQIEITKFYEKLPSPAMIVMNEYLEDKLEFEYRDEEGNTIE